jgi:hypothetical protein
MASMMLTQGRESNRFNSNVSDHARALAAGYGA